MLAQGDALMRAVLIAFGRALASQLHYRMLLLTLLPFFLSLAIWGVILWFGLQPMIDAVRQFFVENDGFRIAGGILAWVGLSALKAVLVPLIVMWVLLPLMIVTALIFIGLFAMPVIIKHVGGRHYPALRFERGGSFWGSLWLSSSSFFLFVLLWIITLPLSAIPPMGLIIPAVLWGWLTYRVLAYDALAEHASAEERQIILRRHRWPLLAIGAATGAMGAAPTLLWLGGALSVIFFPLFAGVSIWLYVLVFVFTGLWFQYYCLEALTQLRQAPTASSVLPQQPAPQFKDIN